MRASPLSFAVLVLAVVLFGVVSYGDVHRWVDPLEHQMPLIGTEDLTATPNNS